MSIIKPFKAVRPRPELASLVASLPYDVMNADEARNLSKGNPYSFLHVSRAEIDLSKDLDHHAPQVYEKARENFYQMLQDGVLEQDSNNLLYIYEQRLGQHRQTGLVACSSVEDYFKDIIKKHELTRPEKEEDRIRHMEYLHAHAGPIFLTYPKNISVDKIISSITEKQKPVYDFQAADAVHHKVWIIQDNDKIDELVGIFNYQVPYTYIADGHHRTASAARVGLKMRSENPEHSGKEEYNFFLSVLFPDDQLKIMDYNRLVKDLNGLSEEDFLSEVGKKFTISPVTPGRSGLNHPDLDKNLQSEFPDQNIKPEKLHEFAMYLKGRWYKLKAKGEIVKSDPIGVLDIAILQENILAPLLGIRDPRTDKRIDFVGGIRGLKELQQRVESGEMKVAFALFPVSLKQLMDIADSGNVMPPKSTWFEPKLRDGLFSHLF